MLYFLLGLITGGAVGVTVMCLLQMNREAEYESSEISSAQDEFEKTVSAGVDNTEKKA